MLFMRHFIEVFTYRKSPPEGLILCGATCWPSHVNLAGLRQPALSALHIIIILIVSFISAGTGCMGFALARAYDNMHVTLMDVPRVTELIKHHFMPPDIDALKIELLPGE